MRLKHWIFNLYRKYVWLLSHIGKKVKLDINSGRSELYIITIAYNHSRLIEKQIELVKQYVTDNCFLHIIVDNSPNRKIRQQIKDICEREQVKYVNVPIFIDKLISHKLFGNGLSHGAALNWMFYHLLKSNRPVRFAVLDHDVFPLKGYSLTEKLGKSDFIGVERNMGVGWYLWPGWCVLRFEAIEKCRPNFLPVFINDTYLGSGGGNYSCFYCKYNHNEMSFPEVTTKRVKKTQGLHKHNDIYHSDCIQFIDHSWLHIINGSNCAHVPEKETFVDYIIDNLEAFHE